ncbi:flavodoxin domain-containing protein [Candidatus Chlorohelix sp.]|uniref:flavodoxin domain-containing protein n=1 Tax=Candidatus Chlorohelix sp. TaxID=3139201 RepID=UPI00303BD4BA
MAKLLIVYGTGEGQTTKIAERIAEVVQGKGHVVEVVRGNELPSNLNLANYHFILVGASIHSGKHQPYIVKFVKSNLDLLSSKPSAFFSVSVSAVSKVSRLYAVAEKYLDRFQTETGWKPANTILIGGALQYTKYNIINKVLLRIITRNSLGPTDIKRDYEYTDWEQVTKFAESLVPLLDKNNANSAPQKASH